MRYLLLGSGRMGRAVAYDLCSSGVTELMIADKDSRLASQVLSDVKKRLKPKTRLSSMEFDASKAGASDMKGFDCVISCLPYEHNYRLAKAAVAAKAHFCDLGGNNAIVEKELSLHRAAKKAGITIVPDCGLAPGMVSILAARCLGQLGGKADHIRIRDGGLPQHPKPPLDYMIVFSAHGLINEYKEKCRILRNGKMKEVEPLTGIEPISFPGYPGLEAAHNSGGVSTLVKTMQAKVRNLDYKTVRYRGHWEKVRLLFDLGFFDEEKLNGVSPREVNEAVLSKRLRSDDRDLVLCRVEGERSRLKRTIEFIDRYDEASGLTAMQRCTAFPISIIAQMLANGDVKEKGAVPQELCIEPMRFISELRKRGLAIREF